MMTNEESEADRRLLTACHAWENERARHSDFMFGLLIGFWIGAVVVGCAAALH